MDDEAESSRAGLLRHRNSSTSTSDADVDPDHEHTVPDVVDIAEDEAAREQTAKGRRSDAKKKRVAFLDHLLRELDTFVFLELVTIYHLDCSFFWFLVRTVIQLSLLTPIPDLGLTRQHDEHKPFLLVIVSFGINFLLHAIYPAPSAGEDTRGYLHGGLMIDFIGQEGPTSKWKLVILDSCLLILQLVMVSVHAKRRVLKKNLASMTAGASATTSTEGEASSEAVNAGGEATTSSAEREQDFDSEERGVLRRTDTLSDIGADLDEDDALLPSTSESGNADALDMLSSGLCVIGEFSLIDTLIQEHRNYNEYRQTRTEARAASSLSPSTLRHLQTIRMRIGVGGG